jgi:hypothetical protein
MLTATVLALLQLGSPQIKSQFEAALQPYFPNARVVMQPQAHVLMGFTCITGAGPQLAIQAATELQNKMTKNGVTDVATRLFLAAAGYRYIVVGFDSYVAEFDLQSKTAGYKAVGDAGYGQSYRRECGL